MRYGHQQLDARGLVKWPVARVQAMAQEIAELVKAENAAGKPEE